jgi:hypothetical protein
MSERDYESLAEDDVRERAEQLRRSGETMSAEQRARAREEVKRGLQSAGAETEGYAMLMAVLDEASTEPTADVQMTEKEFSAFQETLRDLTEDLTPREHPKPIPD